MRVAIVGEMSGVLLLTVADFNRYAHLMSRKNRKFKAGDVFGKLTLVEPYWMRTPRGNRWYHRCKCRCGRLVKVEASNMTKGVACGCEARQRTSGIKDGDVFGDRTVLQAYASQRTYLGAKSKPRWHHRCQCKCGKIDLVDTTHLKKKAGQRCRQCGDKKQILDGKQAAKNSLFRNYKRGAMNRGHVFDLSKDEFFEIVERPCFYCGRENQNTTTTKHKSPNRQTYKSNGIDRVDNTIGYVAANCVPCCPTCNRMKLCQTKSEFLDAIRRIYERHFCESPMLV